MLSANMKLMLLFGLTFIFCSILACAHSNMEIRKTLFPNGQMKEEWSVKMDQDSNYVAQGYYMSWYENGQKKQVEQWQDGKLNGVFITWYENGMKWQTGAYVNGEMNCLYREWSPDGKKVVEGKMVNGLRQGKWTYWDGNGNIFKQEDYKNGELLE